ncbi:nucleophosmin 1a [Erpetoichthys calabaricus]|uniref:Nucleophosmin n=1 Tax=Erpetoichthys calabaricus TaxID=27687 RepID=A0A8C4T1D2_ERPCA|nr:nucleophosmin 1a [Erpetoichthys calabaricus]
MEDSMSMENMRPQNFLFGCELVGNEEQEVLFHDDENEHQLSIRTVCVDAAAKDELHIVEVEGLDSDGNTIKAVIASLKPSLQPMVSLGGFEMAPPVTFRLKKGSGPVHISGQHLVALCEDMSSDEEDEEESENSKPQMKRPAPARADSAQLKKKAKLAEEDEDDLEDEDEDDEDDDDEEDEEEEEEEEKTPVKKLTGKTPTSQNGKPSKPTALTPKQDFKETKGKPQTPGTPRPPLTIEEVKAKMNGFVEKGSSLPKVEAKFVNFVKNCFHIEDKKTVQDLWKWRQTIKDKK